MRLLLFRHFSQIGPLLFRLRKRNVCGQTNKHFAQSIPADRVQLPVRVFKTAIVENDYGCFKDLQAARKGMVFLLFMPRKHFGKRNLRGSQLERNGRERYFRAESAPEKGGF